jgi:hypothetical protein
MTPAACTRRSTRPAASTTVWNWFGSALSAAVQRAPISAADASSLDAVRAVSTTS